MSLLKGTRLKILFECFTMISLGEARRLCQLIKFSIKCWKILEITIQLCALQMFIEIY